MRPCRRPVASAYFRTPEWLAGADRQRRARARRPSAASTANGQADRCSTCTCRTTARAAARSAPQAEILKLKNPAEVRPAAAHQHPQAQFLGRSSATCSTTAPSIWATSPTTRDVIGLPSRCAGVSAGRKAVRDLAGCGLETIAEMIRDDIAHGRAMSRGAAAAWCSSATACMRRLAPTARPRAARRAPALPVSAPALPGPRARRGAGRSRRDTVGERRRTPVAARRPGTRASASCRSPKMHAIGDEVLDGPRPSRAPRRTADGLVIGSRRPFASAPTCSRWARPAVPGSSSCERDPEFQHLDGDEARAGSRRRRCREWRWWGG